MLYVARVPSAFVTQGLNEKLVCEKRRAGVLCLHHKDRIGEGQCVLSVGSELAGEVHWKECW
jgi:hypothetical protein